MNKEKTRCACVVLVYVPCFIIFLCLFFIHKSEVVYIFIIIIIVTIIVLCIINRDGIVKNCIIKLDMI